jgi:hypothetical protein
MNNSTITNLCIFIGICIFSYLIFRNLNTNNSSYVEGMTTTTDASGNPPPPPGAITNGVAGNAAAYAAQLKSAVIKSQDELLISKYRSDYENVVLNLDDYINNMMLQTALTVNQNNPQISIAKLAQMQQAKVALNSTMKFIDASK